MAPPESVPSATVTDLAAARRDRTAGPRKPRADAGVPTPARKPANRRFDKEKVDRLKAEIADGSYEIDPARVADRFIEHERNS